jgi:hypothetical protein
MCIGHHVAFSETPYRRGHFRWDREIAHHEIAVGGMIRQEPIVIGQFSRRSHPLTAVLAERNFCEARNAEEGMAKCSRAVLSIF